MTLLRDLVDDEIWTALEDPTWTDINPDYNLDTICILDGKIHINDHTIFIDILQEKEKIVVEACIGFYREEGSVNLEEATTPYLKSLIRNVCQDLLIQIRNTLQESVNRCTDSIWSLNKLWKTGYWRDDEAS